MKSKALITLIIAMFALSGLSSCRSKKHCPALDPTMEGYDKKAGKKKRGRQEGLTPKKSRIRY